MPHWEGSQLQGRIFLGVVFHVKGKVLRLKIYHGQVKV